MAITTLTASAYLDGMRQHHVGVNYIIGHVEKTGTLSDIILLGKIPNGATLVDFRMHGAGAGTAAVAKVGIKGGNGGGGAGAETTIVASHDFASGAGVTSTALIRHRVSLSDTDAQAGADVYMTLISGTWSTTVSFDYQIGYIMTHSAKDVGG